ncbi:efflux RND transporter periplasmic adaptor subunit [Clostridium sp. C2-6-12]|uniref:HlyD family secretion protein n=1 Tax=Clostridium sp. C2-6-12 TaxID=2698832 RepID=UPI00136B505D|nr:efflux RND transporter periplasmic adaptor subunit [Clostridium sp. C2-6-12]
MKKTILVCLFLTITLSGCSSAQSTNNNSQIIENKQEQTKNTYIMAGKIDANDQVNLAAKSSAKVSEILVDVGAKVNAGDTIIKLDTQELQAQVDQAQAAVNVAKANLTNAMSTARPEQIAQDEASLKSATEAYEVAKKNYERTNALFQADAATQQQLETSKQQFVTAESQQKTAQEVLNMHKNGATQTSIDVYRAQVDQAEAALKTVQTSLNNGTITSPISGVVTAKNINVGEMASPNSPLISISNTSALYVNAYAPLDIVSQLTEGQDVVVKISDVENKEFEGKITVINSKLNSQSRNVLVKVSLSDSNSELKPGMLAEIGLKK